MSTLRIIKKTVKYWYFGLLVGLLLVGVGLWSIIFPRQSIAVIAFVFSLTFLLTGLFEIIFAIANREEITDWGWILALGILKLVVGVLLLVNPAISALTLAFYVGFIVFFRSLSTLIMAFNLKRYLVLRWGNLLAMGIIGLILAFVLLLNPSLTSVAIAVWAGLSLVITGIMSFYWSLKLKKIKTLAGKISTELLSRYQSVQREIEDIFRK